MKSYTKSHELYQRAKLSLAGGVSSQFRLSERPHPLFYEKAEGARIWDVDGNEYLDFTLSQGPMILGHSHPAVLQAARELPGRKCPGKPSLTGGVRVGRSAPCNDVLARPLHRPRPGPPAIPRRSVARSRRSGC